MFDEPPHRLRFWNENYNQCYYCYVQFKNRFSNFVNDFHATTKLVLRIKMDTLKKYFNYEGS